MVYEEAPSSSSILHLALEAYTTQVSLGISHLGDSFRHASWPRLMCLIYASVLDSEPGNPGPQHACGMGDQGGGASGSC